MKKLASLVLAVVVVFATSLAAATHNFYVYPIVFLAYVLGFLDSKGQD